MEASLEYYLVPNSLLFSPSCCFFARDAGCVTYPVAVIGLVPMPAVARGAAMKQLSWCSGPPSGAWPCVNKEPRVSGDRREGTRELDPLEALGGLLPPSPGFCKWLVSQCVAHPSLFGFLCPLSTYMFETAYSVCPTRKRGLGTMKGMLPLNIHFC